MSETPDNPPTSPKKMSRRAFLRVAGGAGAVLTAGAFLKGPQIGEFALRNPEILDQTLALVEDHFTKQGVTVAEKVTEKTPEDNPGRKPMLDIIKEGVAAYGKPVHYEFNSKRKPDQFWEERMHQMAGEINGVDLIKIASGDYRAGLKAENAYSSAIHDWDFMEATGTKNLYYKTATFNRLSDISKLEGNSFSGKSDEEIRVRLIETANYLKDQSLNGPVSASTVLKYFLEGDNGDLAMAIEDTAIFLKAYARNDLETGKWLGADDSNIQEKLRRYGMIKDEYLPKGKHFMEDVTGESKFQEPDLDTNNLIGIAYHAWDTIATLRILPQRTTAKAAVLRVITKYVNQGNFKLASDTNVARQLNDLEKYFTSLAA